MEREIFRIESHCEFFCSLADFCLYDRYSLYITSI